MTYPSVLDQAIYCCVFSPEIFTFPGFLFVLRQKLGSSALAKSLGSAYPHPYLSFKNGNTSPSKARTPIHALSGCDCTAAYADLTAGSAGLLLPAPPAVHFCPLCTHSSISLQPVLEKGQARGR